LDVIEGASPCRDRVAVDSIREAPARWWRQRLPLTRLSSRGQFSSRARVKERRLEATREALAGWAMPLGGGVFAVLIVATRGWRWVARGAFGARARGATCRAGAGAGVRGRTRRPKTGRLDARWLVLLVAKEVLPEAWRAPEEMQELRDKTRLRLALSLIAAVGRNACTRCFSTRAGRARGAGF
jgi:hypothetical protein